MPTETPDQEVETPDVDAQDATAEFEHLPDDHPLVKTLKTLREELKASKTAAATSAEKAKKWDEAEAANLSELEKAQQRLAELEQSANAATLKALRAEVANESGVPASLLIGDTEEALRESAAALLAYKGTAPKAPTSDGQGTVGKPISTSAGQVTEAEFRSMSPAEINVALREGRLKNILGTS